MCVDCEYERPVVLTLPLSKWREIHCSVLRHSFIIRNELDAHSFKSIKLSPYLCFVNLLIFFLEIRLFKKPTIYVIDRFLCFFPRK